MSASPSSVRALVKGPSIKNADPLLTIPEAAAYLSIRPQTLNNWRTTGRFNIPAVKVGRLVRFKQSDLDSFIARRTEASEADA
jgi:excisionase family DNA binding protein